MSDEKRQADTRPSMSPPWIIFSDRGKPVAILPAGRPGEVADVRHLSKRAVTRIVKLANDLHAAIVDARLECAVSALEDLRRSLRLPNAKEPSDGDV